MSVNGELRAEAGLSGWILQDPNRILKQEQEILTSLMLRNVHGLVSELDQ